MDDSVDIESIDFYNIYMNKFILKNCENLKGFFEFFTESESLFV